MTGVQTCALPISDRSGFNDRGPRHAAAFAPRDDRGGDRNFAPRNEGFAPRNEGFAPRNEGFASRNDGFAPRPDFANRKPAFVKPAGKVFVPRDAAKKSAKFSKARD